MADQQTALAEFLTSVPSDRPRSLARKTQSSTLTKLIQSYKEVLASTLSVDNTRRILTQAGVTNLLEHR